MSRQQTSRIKPGEVACAMCKKVHLRRTGVANVKAPICQECADRYAGITDDNTPKDKVRVKIGNWK